MLAFMVTRQTTLHVTLLIKVFLTRFRLSLHLELLDCSCVGFCCFGKVFHRLVTVTNSQEAIERVSIKLDKLFIVCKSLYKFLLEQ